MRILSITILCCCLVTAYSQDLIVTEKGDSINCKITNIKTDYIHFTFKYEKEIRNTLLPIGQIHFYKQNFYSKSEVPSDKIKNIDGDYQKVRFTIYGGWSYRTAKVGDNVPSGLQEYIKELKSGYHIGGDFNYYFSENIGFGLKYSMFRSTNELNNIYIVDENGQGRTGKVKDDITIQYFGPTLSSSFSSSNKKPRFITEFSLGYLSYKNKATVIDDFTITGGTLGLLLGLGVDVPINENLSLEFIFAYTAGTLNQYKYQDNMQTTTIKLDKDNLESLSRIDFSIGLRLSK
jgi:hypothetical protein